MKLLYLFLLSVLLIVSCAEDPVISSGDPVISSIEPLATYYGDTITIFGSNFGDRADSSFVVFDSVRINSRLVEKWGISAVQLIIPDSVTSGEVFIMIDSIESNRINIEIEKLPPYNVTQVSAGSFRRGSQSGSPDELPAMDITLTRDLIVFTMEVSQRLYKSAIGENPSPRVNPDLPVYGLTWRDAVRFCNAMSDIEGLSPAYEISPTDVVWDHKSKGWRLPTEAEWEYLAKAGVNDDFGGKLPQDIAWFDQNSGLKPHAGGKKVPNAFGLYDVQGNVWEWCWDRYSYNYYKSSETTDPSGPPSGTRRVKRGGNFRDAPAYLRASNRSLPQGDDGTAGIRIVRNK